MSEVGNFPAAEFDNVSVDLAGQLIEEIRLYPTEAEFQLSLKGLEAKYSGTPFYEMIEGVAGAIAVVSASVEGKPHKARSWASMFQKGGLIGMHIATTALPDNLGFQIRRLADQDCEALQNTNLPETRSKIFDLIGDLEEMDATGFDPNDKDIVYHAAALSDTDMNGDSWGRWHFALGYRFAVDKAAEASEQIEGYEDLDIEYEVPEEQEV